jgi:NAD(P)-dependent dehydrogenase (short-subunit alcohol dehydrogenase family)
MPGGRRPGPGRTPDMTNQAAVAEFARRTVQRFGRIDIWVNNAGVYLLGSLEATRPKPSGGCSRPIFFRLRPRCCPLPRPRSRRADQQRLGLLPHRRTLARRLCEQQVFAVRGFSEALRQELADLADVHVCTVSPSPIDTPIFASAANYSGRTVKAPPPTFRPSRWPAPSWLAPFIPSGSGSWGRRPLGHRGRSGCPAPVRAGQPPLCQRAAVRRRASPRHRRQPVRSRLRRPR